MTAVIADAAGPRSSVVQPRRAKLLGLQILRFGAAFAVVLFHIGSGYQLEFGNTANHFAFGAAGVDVFFVLSGLIIAMTTDPVRGCWHFCRRRLVRVVPLYWSLTLGIALIGLAAPSLLNSTVVTPETVLKSLLFIPYERPNGAMQPLLFLGWTLNYEMFFYAIYAFCLLLGQKSPLAPLLIVTLLVVAGRIFTSDNVLWNFYTNPILIEFALGVGIYLVYSRNPEWFAGRSAALGVAAAASFILLRTTPGVPWLIASGLPAVLLVSAFVGVVPGPSRWLALLVLFGDASYSLYLSHPYVIQLLSKLSPADLPVAWQIPLGAVTSLICIGASVLLYRFVEIGLQRRLTPPRPRPVST